MHDSASNESEEERRALNEIAAEDTSPPHLRPLPEEPFAVRPELPARPELPTRPELPARPELGPAVRDVRSAPPATPLGGLGYAPPPQPGARQTRTAGGP